MPRSLIECYRSIEESSEKMLMAARSADWEQVVQYEGICSVLIAQLRDCARLEDLEPNERREKSSIMRNILLIDAKIRAIAEPWVDQLAASSANLHQDRVLH